MFKNSAMIENDIVTNVIVGELEEHTPCPDNVGIGHTVTRNIDGSVKGWDAPTPETTPPPTVQEQIDAIEATQTARMLRGAALGDAESKARLQTIETKINALRPNP